MTSIWSCEAACCYPAGPRGRSRFIGESARAAVLAALNAGQSLTSSGPLDRFLQRMDPQYRKPLGGWVLQGRAGAQEFTARWQGSGHDGRTLATALLHVKLTSSLAHGNSLTIRLGIQLTNPGRSRPPSRTPHLDQLRPGADAIGGLRKSVAGDETALYNALLLTLRDAAKVPGRKVVIVFSNGPDNSSMVAPDDVRAVAEDEGIPIYVISTNEVNKDPISSGVFRRIATRTGGKAYWAKTWQKQVEAFESIREDLGNSYRVTSYRKANRTEGSRKIAFKIVMAGGKNSRVPPRPGYRPRGEF